jgi:hypothetical protein
MNYAIGTMRRYQITFSDIRHCLRFQVACPHKFQNRILHDINLEIRMIRQVVYSPFFFLFSRVGRMSWLNTTLAPFVSG